jgi:glycosyltransferase involved in cell wall biosynthesis
VARPRIGIFVVAYNAVTTLARTLDRIPAELREMVDEIFVFDDASTDDTWLLAKGYQQVNAWKNLTVFRNPVNKGYGGNQKLGYRYASERGLDFVVLLHGDGQYAPEAMPRMLAPLLEGRADAVFGSRMMERGAARKGGMPLYKFVGNKILSAYQNRVLGMRLSEFHSGYRAYSLRALRQISTAKMTDDFHFDTEIIIKLHHQGFKISEVPIPTFYGDEICYVNGLKYAADIVRAVRRYRSTVRGGKPYPEFEEYFQPGERGVTAIESA